MNHLKEEAIISIMYNLRAGHSELWSYNLVGIERPHLNSVLDIGILDEAKKRVEDDK